MKRGDIVAIADPRAGDFGGKPRPALIVQADAFLSEHASVTVCLITSQLAGLGLFRLQLPADGQTGLLTTSEVCIDKIQTVWRKRIRQRIGRAPEEIVFQVDQALRRWLAL